MGSTCGPRRVRHAGAGSAALPPTANPGLSRCTSPWCWAVPRCRLLHGFEPGFRNSPQAGLTAHTTEWGAGQPCTSAPCSTAPSKLDDGPSWGPRDPSVLTVTREASLEGALGVSNAVPELPVPTVPPRREAARREWGRTARGAQAELAAQGACSEAREGGRVGIRTKRPLPGGRSRPALCLFVGK